MHNDALLKRPVVMLCVALLALSAIAIAAIGTWTNLDVNLANGLYDTALRDFPLHHSWWAERFSHEILKIFFTVMAVAIIAAVVWDIVRPHRRWNPLFRVQARVLALCAVAVPLVISVLKKASVSHCPWDLTMYGGAEPYVRLFDVLPLGAHAGHCLPAGHASSALWLVVIGVFWLPARPRMALAMSALGLSVGVALGYIQQLRGAHFLTHTLWSIWLACAIALAIVTLLPRVRR